MSDKVLTTHQLLIGHQHPLGPPLSVALQSGELVGLIGPNGVGKSTLLRTLAGMQPSLGGRIALMGDDLQTLPPRELARRLSVVLTERVDVGRLPAWSLVALGRHPYTDWLGRLTAHDTWVVQRAIEAVGATELAGRSFDELSDGERQRIMIARALAQEPAIMILDEPTAFLDLPSRVEVMRILRDLTRKAGCAILFSTHDLDLALRTTDRMWLMSPGGLLVEGAPEDLILNGAFQAVFQGRGVTFDAQAGSFHIEAAQGPAVGVVGEGLPAMWTRRALSRAGYAVVESEAEQMPVLSVEVVARNSHTVWRVIGGGRDCEQHSIGDLIGFLDREGRANTTQPG